MTEFRPVWNLEKFQIRLKAWQNSMTVWKPEKFMNKMLRDKSISSLKLVNNSDKLKFVKYEILKFLNSLIMCYYSLKPCKILICSLKTWKILNKIDMMIMIKYGYYISMGTIQSMGIMIQSIGYYYSKHGYYAKHGYYMK